jgi:hypothetical protein
MNVMRATLHEPPTDAAPNNPAESKPERGGWAAGLILAVAVLLFLGYALRYFNYLVDDALIPMRYALNFWRGHGFVENPGERVDACTSPLHLLYLTLSLRLLSPDQSVFVSKFLGLGIGIYVLFLTRRLGLAAFPRSPWPGNAAPLVVALYPGFALSMINGLETEFAVLFLTAGLLQFTKDIGTEDAHYRRSALLFLGAAFSRPELIVAFPALAAIRYARHRDRRLLPALALYLVPLLALFLGRYLYYGDFLPNTYYAKATALARSARLGAQYWEAFTLLGVTGYGLALTAIGIGALVGFARRQAWPLLTVLGLHILFLLKSGGDWMVDGRFVAVIAPLCALVWCAAFWAIWEVRKSLLPGIKFAGPGIAGLLLVCLAGMTLQNVAAHVRRLQSQIYLHDIRFALAPHAPLERWMVGNKEGRIRESRWIASHARPGETALISEMGLIPLQNMDIRFIDSCGLTDRTVARMHYLHTCGGVQTNWQWMKTGGEFGRYIQQRRPEWIVLVWDQYGHSLDDASRRFGDYAPSGTFPFTYEYGSYTIATWNLSPSRVVEGKPHPRPLPEAGRGVQ